MTIRDKIEVETVAPPQNRLPLIFDVYCRALAGALMLLGLRQWAVILGLTGSAGGMFERMGTAWQLATMHFAVVDLVASIGLWMRVAWGNVVWIYAALVEIVLHTAFYTVFGMDYLVVAFHLITIVAFFVLYFMAHRKPA